MQCFLVTHDPPIKCSVCNIHINIHIIAVGVDGLFSTMSMQKLC